MRYLVIFLALMILASASNAQTATPTPTETPTPTSTPTPPPWSYATIAPESTDAPGQMTRFDYTATAGDVHIANLLTAILVSGWAMFFFALVVYGRRK